MAIPQHHSDNFETLTRAFNERNVCLMECTDATTGQPVMVICMVNETGDEYQMVPVAKMIDGNPYEQLLPPTSEAA